MPRLCVRVRVYVWVRVFIDFTYWLFLNLIKAPGPRLGVEGDGNGGRFVRSFCLFFFEARFCVPLSQLCNVFGSVRRCHFKQVRHGMSRCRFPHFKA